MILSTLSCIIPKNLTEVSTYFPLVLIPKLLSSLDDDYFSSDLSSVSWTAHANTFFLPLFDFEMNLLVVLCFARYSESSILNQKAECSAMCNYRFVFLLLDADDCVRLCQHDVGLREILSCGYIDKWRTKKKFDYDLVRRKCSSLPLPVMWRSVQCPYNSLSEKL